MKFSPTEKAKLVEELALEPNKVQRLRELDIPTSTYYAWKRRVAERNKRRWETFIQIAEA